MARRFGQMLWIGSFWRRARFGRLRAIALLRVARLLALAVTRRLIAVSRTRRARCAIPALPMRLARRARGFSGKVGGRNETVYRNHWNLAFYQSLDVSEKL